MSCLIRWSRLLGGLLPLIAAAGSPVVSPAAAEPPAVAAAPAERREVSGRPLAPMTFRDTGKNTVAAYAGVWAAYRMFHQYPAAKLPTEFVLTADGKWFSREGDAKPTELGTFKVADDYILLHPKTVAGKPADGTRAIPGPLLDRDRFVLVSETGATQGVMYRRESSVRPVAVDALEGRWRFFDVDPGTQRKRPSPFLLEFKRDNTYEVQVTGTGFAVPDGAEKGVWSVEKDVVMLKNTCGEPGPWRDMRFFMLFDNLILNQPGGYVFGVRE